MALVSMIGTLAFVVMSLVVGCRVLVLSRSTHRVPALSIGLTFLLTAGLGFPMLTLVLLTPERLGASLALVQAAGVVAVSLGATALYVFTWRTFRPGQTWATAVVVAAVLVLTTSFVAQALTAGYATPVRGGAWFWVGFATRALSLGWAAAESLRYYGLMRKRLRLGLVEPLVANRFLLWGIGALAGGVMTAISAVTIVSAPAGPPDLISALRLGGSAWGLTAAVTTWLAFFPPDAYRRRFQRAATESLA